MFEHRPNALELASTFASLKEKILIIEAFERTTLANAAWRIARAEDAVSTSTSEVEMLRELGELPQPARRISRVDVDSILHSHSMIYPLTPDLIALVGLGVLRPDGPDGFFIWVRILCIGGKLIDFAKLVSESLSGSTASG